MLRHIAALAPTHVAALWDDPRDLAHVDMLNTIAATVHLEPRALSKPRAIARALLSGQPASVAAFASAALQRRVDELLATRPIRTIFAYSGQMAQFVPHDLDGRRFVMDFVDMDSAKFAAYADAANGLSSCANTQEAKRLFEYEKTIATYSHLSLFVSHAEASLFRERTGLSASKVSYVENGIDLSVYDPTIARPSVKAPSSVSIVFTGQMDYRPNIDAVVDFAMAVMPKIRAVNRSVCFAIVGRNPTPAVLALAQLPNIIVTGEVADTRDWLAAATVVVAPLKLARGIQNKVLEAMAMACAVVASSAAAEGIDADGALIVTDGAAEQARAILALLADPALRHRLGQAARARMVARYSWDATLAGLPAMLGFDT